MSSCEYTDVSLLDCNDIPMESCIFKGIKTNNK